MSQLYNVRDRYAVLVKSLAFFPFRVLLHRRFAATSSQTPSRLFSRHRCGLWICLVKRVRPSGCLFHPFRPDTNTSDCAVVSSQLWIPISQQQRGALPNKPGSPDLYRVVEGGLGLFSSDIRPSSKDKLLWKGQECRSAEVVRKTNM